KANAKRRALAALALANLERGNHLAHAASTAEAVSLLIGLLKEKETLSRRTALKALAEFGPEARAAIPELGKTLEDQDIHLRAHALHALAAIGPAARAALPAVVKLLSLTAEEQSNTVAKRAERHCLAVLAADTLWRIQPGHP